MKPTRRAGDDRTTKRYEASRLHDLLVPAILAALGLVLLAVIILVVLTVFGVMG